LNDICLDVESDPGSRKTKIDDNMHHDAYVTECMCASRHACAVCRIEAYRLRGMYASVNLDMHLCMYQDALERGQPFAGCVCVLITARPIRGQSLIITCTFGKAYQLQTSSWYEAA